MDNLQKNPDGSQPQMLEDISEQILLTIYARRNSWRTLGEKPVEASGEIPVRTSRRVSKEFL